MSSLTPLNWTTIGYGVNSLGIVASLLCLAAMTYVFVQQRKGKEYLGQEEIRKQIDLTRKILERARLTSREIAAMAVEAGMKPHDVFREYVNDVDFRKEIVHRVLGNNDVADGLNMAKKMIEKYPSRFVSQGYPQQLDFLEALPAKERHRPVPIMSVRLPPVLEVTKEKKSDSKSKSKKSKEKESSKKKQSKQ